MKIESRRRAPSAPLSAMSDIGFLLLIFIMLISLINYRKEVKIEYPEASQIERTEADHQLEIWIQQDGAVLVDGHNVSSTELENIIVDAFLEQADTRIHILADRRTAYKDVEHVIKILQTLQHRVVSFVVKEDL
ncbi:biopolymer transporter ExbD [Oceanispirochaeta sp. M2]|nr:biopolymer transporter ExbD [Oceanispirochaeta sp. M1]MBF9015078.1 biopolymer transporter ExbD [Oceanispirochaeta sp. M2]NPD71536.1 biopolymer transporter ExbD [Oceanispirochaeta sp. M1]RDG33107.1 biopolymer transporter ExbD [Oceanispirochaeta sp. M1]